MRTRALRARVARPTMRRVGVAAAACTLALACLCGTSTASAAPLESGVSSSSDSWVVLPMGQFSDQSNTFWQLLHTSPGSSRWSVVTPPGVADNGGLVAGASPGSVLVGFLPSGRLHFSPLSQSGDDGRSWSPEFLPGGLAPVPDALAYAAGGALAVVGGGTVLAAGPRLSAWSPLASTTQLRRAAPRCGVSGVSAVAFSPTGSPMVATGCARGGTGIFTRTTGSWRLNAIAFPRSLARAGTSVLRLEPSGADVTALVQAATADRHALVALWQDGTGWSASAPLPLPPGSSLRATSMGPAGTLAVLSQTKDGLVAQEVAPGRSWSQLPTPPAGTLALAAVAPVGLPLSAGLFDAFSVRGTVLSVFALTPAGTRWVPAQTIRVPLAYGSSS